MTDIIYVGITILSFGSSSIIYLGLRQILTHLSYGKPYRRHRIRWPNRLLIINNIATGEILKLTFAMS